MTSLGAEDFLTVPEVKKTYRFRSDRAARDFMVDAGGGPVGGKLLVRVSDAARLFDHLGAQCRAQRDESRERRRATSTSRRGPAPAPVVLERGSYLD